jgi:hypothetical protein
MRPNLLIRYVGPRATRLFGREPGATWDWHEIRWCDVATLMGADLYSRVESGNKLQAVAKYASDYAYDYESIALVDDDVIPHECTWSDIFAAFNATGLRVGMPALEPYPGDPEPGGLQRRIHGARYHRATHIDAMVMLFTRDAFFDYLPRFRYEVGGENCSSWAFAEAPRGGCVYLDSTPVRHLNAVMTDDARRGVRHRGDPDGACAAFWARSDVAPTLLHEGRILEVVQ